MSDSQIIRAFAAKLIERLGGLDAVAALLTARFGKEVHKGTLSKRQSGDLEWPMSHIWALEDATGDNCISAWRVRQLPEVEDSLSLLRCAADLARENGEAMAAVADLAAGAGSIDTARKEVSDLVMSGKRLASILERKGE